MIPPFRLAAGMAFLATLNCIVGGVAAELVFTLTSPALEEGGRLPADLKCTRDGGEGVSPPLEWTGVPDGTKSFALIMHHYPRGTLKGRDAPSHYWLLWNIPAETTAIPKGNPASLGDEGSDKDNNKTGYTPPCSPGAAVHEYTITLYALDATLEILPNQDSKAVDWAKMTAALTGNVIAQSSLTFQN
ncbi:YbhB/YbcL family Raf kinase inhibitor-like protein [Roseibium polysiphoniae]|uniref:YbhB/YbcL family Raf kinase inhibitor-like protein n=1 Tax=Roseibium polysiphoniae TaxID=2571221 RepID=A0ABR9C6X2_9HYPH|nr:YbhB/YbcL family Raf kinase inhibitor-like protein [Roseibium polysiphoniae]MBD8875338.1 YbhB/YbcL family Raf kinase inhibitor-like protein [Roseibium polysiphoniae]